jgi:putative membrane protein
MLITFLILFALAAVAPQIIPGVTIKRPATAALIAVIFGFLNFVMGWALSLVLTVLSIPLIIVTVGLFTLLIPTIVNTILLVITDKVLDDFEMKGIWPAVGMGLLFSCGLWLASAITG